MIWLIGCKGMLGTEIARQLSENKIDFVGTDIDVDITNPQALAKFVKGKDISYIINCSAYTAVDKAESDADFAKKLNEDGPRNIANLANQIHAKMIHISTDYVFDGTGTEPYTEDMSVAPIGVYGRTKAAGEAAVKQNLKEYYIIRTAWLYGWAGKNFVYTMIKAMNTHDSVKVVNDQKGSPTFAGDLANVIIQIINKDDVPYGTYHCTDLGEITWWDFTNEIKQIGVEKGIITNKECKVNPCTTDEYPTPAKRPAYSVLSKDKIQKTLGIKLPDWKGSLSKFLNSDLFDRSRLL
ncbi:MAG: dTDP-4-dehydrorhamnose reductase [Spirochaetales bacterium]|nr:dTDP-4-dehydrorhamnose reductase [Spirochaetales bacterium]MDY5915282.1 dTDP-4-dehydrorhamnose reductase [Treponema sp.]